MLMLFAILLVTMSVIQCLVLFIKYRKNPSLEKALLWEGSIIQLVAILAVLLIVRENLLPV